MSQALGLDFNYIIGQPDPGYDISYKGITIDVKATTCPNPHLLIPRVEAFKAQVAGLVTVATSGESARVWGVCSKARFWKDYEPWHRKEKFTGYQLHHSKLTPIKEFITWANSRAA